MMIVSIKSCRRLEWSADLPRMQERLVLILYTSPFPLQKEIAGIRFQQKKSPGLLSPKSKMERTTGKEWELLVAPWSQEMPMAGPSTCLLERHPQSPNIHVGSNSACFKLACCSNEDPWNKQELNHGPLLSLESPRHNREREAELGRY